jgi:hypothetical protein
VFGTFLGRVWNRLLYYAMHLGSKRTRLFELSVDWDVHNRSVSCLAGSYYKATGDADQKSYPNQLRSRRRLRGQRPCERKLTVTRPA